MQNLIASPTEEHVALLQECDGFQDETALACYRWLGKVMSVLTDGAFEQYGCGSAPTPNGDAPVSRAPARSTSRWSPSAKPRRLPPGLGLLVGYAHGALRLGARRRRPLRGLPRRRVGRPERDDRALYELLTLEGAQAGLSWSTILRKREGYRRAFVGFDPAKVARFSPGRVEKLLQDPGIVHQPAQGRVDSRERAAGARGPGSKRLLRPPLGFVDGEPLVGGWKSLAELPAETPLSKAMSKELKRRGFRFVGPTVCYAFMQAAGLVNDHTVGCFRYAS